MASYVKAELEKAAPLLKRASVVFRLQGRRCPWPADLEMAPLLGRLGLSGRMVQSLPVPP